MDPKRTPVSEGSGLDTLFFRNRHLLWLSIVVLLIGGASALLSLPRLEDPRIVDRGPIVITSVPGASARRVEALVTEVLERGLDEIEAIKDVDSTSRAGVSLIAIELDARVTASTNEEVFAEIRDKIVEVTPLLPPEAGAPIVDAERDPVAYTFIAGISWDAEREPPLGLMGRLAEDLGDRLRNVPGTELVRVFGEADEEIVVEVDGAELAELGLSAADVSTAIGRADSKLPAGVLRGTDVGVLIEVEGELDSVRRVEAVPLVVGERDAVLTVGDVAELRRGWRTPVDEVALVDGRRSVLVAVRMAGDVRVDRWAANVDAVFEAFDDEHGGGLRVERVFEQERYTTEQLATLIDNLLAGALVVLAVVFFIMGLRPAIVVAFALPLVVASVLLGWQLGGGAIHQMSIFGMIIALGLLIDNAIVVTDEVAAYKARGMSALEAVSRSVRHLFGPLLASTITTALAFAPIMLLPGSAGDFVGSIGTSVVLAIVASFVIAMTITAALAGIFARPTPKCVRPRYWRDGFAPLGLSRVYRRTLRALYGMPSLAVLVALLLPCAGFIAAGHLGSQFFPPIDRDMFVVQLWTPEGSSIESTLGEARDVERTLRALEGVERVDWLVGGSFPPVYYNLVMTRDRSPNYAQGIVRTSSPEATKRLLDRVQVALDDEHPRIQATARQLAQGPPIFADIEYRLFGPDLPALQELGDRLRVALQSHPDVLHTQATLARGEPKLYFAANEEEARLAGLTLTDISTQLESSLEGFVAGSVIEDLERLPIRVRYAQSARSRLDEIASMPLVRAGADRWVHAAALGELSLRPELGGLSRFNGERTNTIKAYVRGGALSIDIGREVMQSLEAEGFALPAGIRMESGGESEQDAEAKADLAAYAPLLATLMVATLILTFRSVRYALVLGAVALLSTGLALLSTWSIDFPISFNTILGTLGLIGVALNDSIVVLAALHADPDARSGDVDAVVATVASCTRHVIATTATTIGGFLPLLLFVGGDFWPSLAIVLAGGISGASLIALLFVPGTFLWMHRSREEGGAPLGAEPVRLDPVAG